VTIRTLANPHLQIVRSEYERTRFERVESPPDPRLAGLVHRYTGYSHRADEPLCRREVAQDAVVLILGFGSPIRVSGPSSTVTEARSFVAPLNASYAVTEEGRVSHGLQVDLSPIGAYMLLGVPMAELSELIVPFENVIGASAPLLLERLFLAADWETRFRLLDAFVLGRLQDARRPSPDVAWAWRRLSETSGRLPIATLARELSCSRRHMVSRFQEQIGPTPKTVARILRFRHATQLLTRDDGRRFAEIALDCGYYDQAHLNRDFRELAGTTPSSFLGNRLPDGFGVAA
jgi:AraC-like DNA-binding protein